MLTKKSVLGFCVAVISLILLISFRNGLNSVQPAPDWNKIGQEEYNNSKLGREEMQKEIEFNSYVLEFYRKSKTAHPEEKARLQQELSLKQEEHASYKESKKQAIKEFWDDLRHRQARYESDRRDLVSIIVVIGIFLLSLLIQQIISIRTMFTKVPLGIKILVFINTIINLSLMAIVLYEPWYIWKIHYIILVFCLIYILINISVGIQLMSLKEEMRNDFFRIQVPNLILTGIAFTGFILSHTLSDASPDSTNEIYFYIFLPISVFASISYFFYLNKDKVMKYFK